MTSSKSTRRALISSALAILMCVVMLIGTTFAWFTDTASTAVNKIQSGKLDVDIVDKDGNSLNGKTLSFKDVNGKTDILWEPGATFNLDSFKIVNKGNLALKYKVTINGVKGSAKLLEAIDFTINGMELADWEGILLPIGKTPIADKEVVGETDTITISGHMKEAAGNEYQGLSIDGIGITVYATQYTYEYDSKDNQYDAKAEFPIGAGTQSDPYLIHDSVTLSQIKNNGTYTYYKVADGVKEIDCTNVSALNLYGEFDGNGATLKNLKKSLFHNVGNGKNGGDDTTVLKNFTAVMNTPNSLVFNISGKNTEFNNVKVSGYMEGTWNMAAFVNYGTKNSDDTGYAYTVNFVSCACDATIVSKSNNSAAILVGHTYPGNGNTATIKLDKATDDGINGAKLIAKPNPSVIGFKYYGVGSATVYVDNKPTTSQAYQIAALTVANPTKNANGTYSVTKAENAATVTTTVNASLTAYNNGTPDKNKAGITFSLGVTTGEDYGNLLGQVKSVEIVNDTQSDDTCKHTLENGTLTVYTNRTDNYATGKVFITVSQYDASGVLVSVGELTIAEKAEVGGSWTIN